MFVDPKVEISVALGVHPPVKGYLEDSGWDLFLPPVEYLLSSKTLSVLKDGEETPIRGLQFFDDMDHPGPVEAEAAWGKTVIIPYDHLQGLDANKAFVSGRSGILVPPRSFVTIPSGLRIIDWGGPYEGPYRLDAVVRERSSMPKKAGLVIFGGQIDFGYTGEIHIQLANLTNRWVAVSDGSRIGQLVFRWVPLVMAYQVQIRKEGSRGSSGLGSTGID